MKQLKWALCLIVMVLTCTTISSCSNDEPSSGKGLKGWYVGDLPDKGSSDYYGTAYFFENKNTVIYYRTISGQPRWELDGRNNSESLNGLPGYYIQRGVSETYSYEIIDNKVYIPMQGRILTIDGNNLRREGTNVIYTKY